jgi:hypothetical protein
VAATQIAYETETGRILSIHHFQDKPGDPKSLRQVAARFTGVAEDRIIVISVQPDEIDSKRYYKVDHKRKALIEVPDGKDGIRFEFKEVQSLRAK